MVLREMFWGVAMATTKLYIVASPALQDLELLKLSVDQGISLFVRSTCVYLHNIFISIHSTLKSYLWSYLYLGVLSILEASIYTPTTTSKLLIY